MLEDDRSDHQLTNLFKLMIKTRRSIISWRDFESSSCSRQSDHQQLKKILKGSRAWKHWKSIIKKFSQDRQSFEEEEVLRNWAARKNSYFVLLQTCHFFTRFFSAASKVVSQPDWEEANKQNHETKSNKHSFIHEKAPKAAWGEKRPPICGYNECVCAAAPAHIVW